MLLSAMMNGINICGNAAFIYICGLGTAGGAIVTVISRFAAAVIMIAFLTRKKHELYIEKSIKYKPCIHYFNVGLRIGAAYLFVRHLDFGTLGVWLAMVCD